METSTCRICLNSSNPGFAIFDAEVEGLSILSKLELCLNEQVLDLAGCPRKICRACNDDLNTAYNFINKYRETYDILKSGVVLYEYDDLAIKQEILDSCDYVIEIDGNSADYVQQNVQNITVDTKPPDNSILKKLLMSKSFTVKKTKTTPEVKKNKSTPEVQKIKSTPQVKNKKRTQVKNKKEQCSLTPKIENENQTKNIIEIEKHEISNAIQPEQLLCDICAAVFMEPRHLTRHKNYVHFPKTLQCEQCPKVFPHEENLKRHIENSHIAGRYICHTCGRSFYQRNVLTKHIKIVHLKLKHKRYKCQYCTKDFANTQSKIIHLRAAHTGERPAVCWVCNARFYHEIYLREHMRLHTGETPFKCPVCNRGYAIRSNMVSHMKNNHTMSSIDPEILAKLRPAIIKKLKP